MKSSFISWLPHCRRSDSLAAALGGKSGLGTIFWIQKTLASDCKISFANPGHFNPCSQG